MVARSGVCGVVISSVLLSGKSAFNSLRNLMPLHGTPFPSGPSCLQRGHPGKPAANSGVLLVLSSLTDSQCLQDPERRHAPAEGEQNVSGAPGDQNRNEPG